MTFRDFIESLDQDESPDVSDYLKALWYAKKDEWEIAHIIARDIPTKEAYWIHAYLHRKKGDGFNADAWYKKADRATPKISLEEEWESLVLHFLKQAAV